MKFLKKIFKKIPPPNRYNKFHKFTSSIIINIAKQIEDHKIIKKTKYYRLEHDEGLQDAVEDWEVFTDQYLQPREILLFSLFTVHCGGTYQQDPFRIHFYIPAYWNTKKLDDEEDAGFTGIPINQWEYLQLHKYKQYPFKKNK